MPLIQKVSPLTSGAQARKPFDHRIRFRSVTLVCDVLAGQFRRK